MQMLLEAGVPTSGDGIVLRTASGVPFTIDRSALGMVTAYKWHPRRSRSGLYLYRKKRIDGKTRYISLHRWLIHAPPGMEVHHKNGNTMDNRLANLELLPPSQHAAYHKIRVFREAPFGSPRKVPDKFNRGVKKYVTY